jgi:hypothetical protein
MTFILACLAHSDTWSRHERVRVCRESCADRACRRCTVLSDAETRADALCVWCALLRDLRSVADRSTSMWPS